MNAKVPPGVLDTRTDAFYLRDHFAALAMHAELNTAGCNPEAADALSDAARAADMSIEQRIAFNAYTLADAMLAQRASTSQE